MPLMASFEVLSCSVASVIHRSLAADAACAARYFENALGRRRDAGGTEPRKGARRIARRRSSHHAKRLGGWGSGGWLRPDKDRAVGVAASRTVPTTDTSMDPETMP